MKVKCDNCPVCHREMKLLYNDFFAVHFLNLYGQIRGQFCCNDKCIEYGIERRHKRQYEDITKDEYFAK